MSPSFGIAIMAAGKGTRLRSKRAKVLHQIGGRPLLEHVIRAATQVVAAEHVVVIVGHQAENVRTAVQHTGVRFALQAEQRGTGHAIMSARKELRDFTHLLVLSGDVPLIRPETIAAVRDFHQRQKASMTVLTARPQDPTGYGRVIRGSKSKPDLRAIVEEKSLTGSQRKAREINSGIYGR
jgi:bifunctional UDP-N-acetylglucosamine pyrophosphorylase / glucosamine-1-phosphate N-acetyltransferase